MTEAQLVYITAHIAQINQPNFHLAGLDNGIELFETETNLKSFLKEYFYESISDPEIEEDVLAKFEVLFAIAGLTKKDFTDKKIPEIANQHNFYKKDLEKFIFSKIQQEVLNLVDKEKYVKNSLEFIKKKAGAGKKFDFTSVLIKKILNKQYHFIGSNGFSNNLLNINSGIMTANAGDSAQFLFLARAILAGYNCSNVDVRSSRYDAVIDYNNILLRVQIKGVSSNNISFKDRDRGGQGINHLHARNRGQRITKKDCDIYVAVDKEVGTCHLIPMIEVDKRDDDHITSVNLSEFADYKENWNVINDLATPDE